MSNPFELLLDSILCEAPEFKSAVAVARYRDRWLLGLSTAKDDRGGKWCAPGGHIKPNESPRKAAERECREETGIICKSVGEPIAIADRPGVAFVPCRIERLGKFDPNSEFHGVGVFTKKDMKSLKLFKNVLRLIDRCS
jgi:8-oxo-dGTP pyrophosphatase MutT (NUDIX family)